MALIDDQNHGSVVQYNSHSPVDSFENAKKSHNIICRNSCPPIYSFDHDKKNHIAQSTAIVISAS